MAEALPLLVTLGKIVRYSVLQDLCGMERDCPPLVALLAVAHCLVLGREEHVRHTLPAVVRVLLLTGRRTDCFLLVDSASRNGVGLKMCIKIS
jgi:hypothetical protein